MITRRVSNPTPRALSTNRRKVKLVNRQSDQLFRIGQKQQTKWKVAAFTENNNNSSDDDADDDDNDDDDNDDDDNNRNTNRCTDGK